MGYLRWHMRQRWMMRMIIFFKILSILAIVPAIAGLFIGYIWLGIWLDKVFGQIDRSGTDGSEGF